MFCSSPPGCSNKYKYFVVQVTLQIFMKKLFKTDYGPGYPGKTEVSSSTTSLALSSLQSECKKVKQVSKYYNMADYEMCRGMYFYLSKKKKISNNIYIPNLFLEHLNFTCIQTNFFFLIFIVLAPSPQPLPPAPSFFGVGAGYCKIPYNLLELYRQE